MISGDQRSSKYGSTELSWHGFNVIPKLRPRAQTIVPYTAPYNPEQTRSGTLPDHAYLTWAYAVTLGTIRA